MKETNDLIKKVCVFVPTDRGWKPTILTEEGFKPKDFCGFTFLVNNEKKLIINSTYNFMVKVVDIDQYFKMLSNNKSIYQQFIIRQQENINNASLVLFDNWYSNQ